MLLFGSKLLIIAHSWHMEVSPTILKEENLHKLLDFFYMGDLSLLHLLTCSAIYLYQCGLMAIYFKL